jgi:3-methyladenine DNA glycosylase Mpg
VTRGALTVRSPVNETGFEIEVTPRIGIRHCPDWPLRYTIKGNPFVSG